MSPTNSPYDYSYTRFQSTKRLLIVLAFLFLLSVIIILFYDNCGKSDVGLISADFDAVERLSETGDLYYQPTDLDFQVHEENTVEVIFRGNISSKGENKGGTLVLPLVLTKAFPQYYYATDGATNSKIKTSSYKTKGGAWAIVALLELASEQTQNKKFDINLILVSSALKDNLSLSVPVKENINGVNTSVTLGKNLFFNSSKVISTFPARTLLDLIKMSAELTNDRPKAIATVPAESNMILDFSGVTFSSTNYLTPFKSSYISLLTLISIATLSLFYRSFINHLSIVGLNRRVKRFKKHYRKYITGGDAPPDYFKFRDELSHRRRSQYAYYRYLALFILALCMGLLLYFVSSGKAQSQPSVNIEACQKCVIANLDMSVFPVENLTEPDKANLNLSFILLSDAVDGENTKELIIDTGLDNSLAFDDIKVINGNVTIAKNSPKQIKINLPITPTNSTLLLTSLNGLPIEKLGEPDDYKTLLRTGNYVKLQLVLKGAQKLYNKTLWSSLHWFPLEGKSYDVPLEFHHPVIFSKVIVSPPVDFYGSVAMLPVNEAFVSQDSNYSLAPSTAIKKSLSILPSNEPLEITSKFNRSTFQILFLTLGQLILAIVLGLFLGAISTRPENLLASSIIGFTGLAAILFGLSYAIRTSVYSTYKDLPNLLSGQIPTLFEIFFVLSLLLSFISIYIVRGRIIAASKN